MCQLPLVRIVLLYQAEHELHRGLRRTCHGGVDETFNKTASESAFAMQLKLWELEREPSERTGLTGMQVGLSRSSSSEIHLTRFLQEEGPPGKSDLDRRRTWRRFTMKAFLQGLIQVAAAFPTAVPIRSFTVADGARGPAHDDE